MSLIWCFSLNLTQKRSKISALSGTTFTRIFGPVFVSFLVLWQTFRAAIVLGLLPNAVQTGMIGSLDASISTLTSLMVLE